MVETLHCPSHGWHPALESVLKRLEAIGSRRRSADYEDLLRREAGARRTPCGTHLEGEVQRALDVLRRVEADELQDLLNLEPPRSTPARG